MTYTISKHDPRGRPFNTSTPMGKMMKEMGLSVSEVAYITGIYNRTLSNYLAARVPMTRNHLTAICALFECEPEDLDYDGGNQ